MPDGRTRSAWILGLSLVAGLALLGYLLGDAALRVRALERTVTVKGLSEREYPADQVIWPIQFSRASNDLEALYAELDEDAGRIRSYLQGRGIGETEITVSVPMVTDKLAQQYGGPPSEFRYAGNRTVTVFSGNVGQVRAAMAGLSAVGRQGVVLASGFQGATEYLFTRLNEVKPGMVEEATRKAREVAQKFAEDSASRLGKIRSANQGQFVIQSRDNNNPHIKRVRVVSTVEYYLSD